MAFRSEGGFTLIETLIALVLVGFMLLLGMTTLVLQPQVIERLDHQDQALEALKTTHEALRAGLLPLQNTELPATSDSPALKIDVEPADVEALFLVRIQANYHLHGQDVTRVLETEVYAP